MAKNVVLLFDGTWNKPSEEGSPEKSVDTNVRRFFRSIRSYAADSSRQLAWYNPGVGTEHYNRLGGGVFGWGLDSHIQDGYRQLCEQYEMGDRVYVLGFSRGAYTARSMVGMVRKCGVLTDPSPRNVQAAYALYRDAAVRAEDEASRSFRTRYSSDGSIHFVGVWDTVGALGIPLEGMHDLNLHKYQFHDTNLASIVRNAFHAIAVDEHRQTYSPTLWHVPESPFDGQRVEQVWFAGAHADVGGGYANQPLSNPPLRWMQRRALECGLGVDVMPEPDNEEECLCPATDSYSNFLGGTYARLYQRHYRPVSAGTHQQKIHWTVIRRLDGTRYSPMNPGLASAIIRDQHVVLEA